ncbi:MAG: type II toxin-antitoxin system MqsA family antitoxin [Treponema sp.]|jgi:YgiT-type zinc finger domain-containing protein|nr:type II toxin-antitoxin system MqsA family antitoxin [Treponema sp.]
MKCGICKADMEEKRVTHTEDVNNSVVVIRNVPAQICTECGNGWYTGAVADKLEKTVGKVLKTALTKIAVIDFAGNVA